MACAGAAASTTPPTAPRWARASCRSTWSRAGTSRRAPVRPATGPPASWPTSGPRAISAMRPAADGVVRPLLCVTAAETRAWCAGQGLEPRDDETNADPAIRRNLIRREVMPALMRVHPGAELNLARSAELLAELDDLVSELASDYVNEVIDLEQVAELPRALRVLVLREAAERAAGRPLRLPRQLTGRLEQLAERRGGVERLSLAADLEAVRDRSHLSFTAPSL